MMSNWLEHIGTPRHSGRYPWGSGNDPYQHGSSNFLSQVEELKSKGLSETEIAKGLGLTTTELRNKKTIALAEQKKAEESEILRLKEKGYSNVAIGERIGRNESYVRLRLKDSETEKTKILDNTKSALKDCVGEDGIVDIGIGSEYSLGVSRTKMKAAVAALKEEGYNTYDIYVPQLGTNGTDKTTVSILCPPGMDYKTAFKNKDQIKILNEQIYSDNKGRSFESIVPPKSISSKRIKINYREDGGENKDGVIELRRGVQDLDLGNSRYAQVRIAVDGTHYLKGMAIYSDNMPKGVDIVFNTNKSKKVSKMDVLKEMKEDPENPFGAVIRQKHYIGKDGKKHLSSLNIVNEEGDWNTWSKSIASQMLSKQPKTLAKKQLDLTYSEKQKEFDTINSLTNPAVKKMLLKQFANDCDSSAVHLKAAGFPRQSTKVILPVNSLKENEVYAPTYRNGEHVCLVRYPHGGTFEIPELVVNNKNREGNSIITKLSRDAVGIHPKVAKKLSGADFDGDTVIVIPTNKNNKISTSQSLKGLENFDPQIAYPGYKGMKVMTNLQKQQQMGNVSNLITDMTLKGATHAELSRAVKHSMVVIDAKKHELNWKQSEIDNNIPQLKEKYQGGKNRGASTLISKASSEQRVGARKDRGIDPITGKKTGINSKTGERVYDYTNETYINKNGKVIKKTISSTKMYETKDANTLSSGTIMEQLYGNYANKMKAMGNQARKEYIDTPNIKVSPSAKKTYAKEVASLNAKLNLSLKHKPYERKAQIIANESVKQRIKYNPDMDKSKLSKIKGQELAKARVKLGGGKSKIHITNSEWKAIQLGAISNNKLTQILNNADMDEVKQLSMPRNNLKMTTTKTSRAKNLISSGYTLQEVADALGVSVSTLENYV